jgi:hypothetical protein
MFPDITKRKGSEVIDSVELLEDLEHGRGLTEAAVSERTRAAYDYEFKRFEAWASRHKLPSLPTTSAIAATYLAHLNRRGTSPATLSVVRAAIKHHHVTLPPRTKGRNLDLATPEIKRLFKGARRKAREAGRKTNKATPWLVEDFNVLAGHLQALQTSSDLEDLRDLALIGLGIVRALRGPSELLALDLAEAKSTGARGALVLKHQGAEITLSVSKTKQTGDGEELPIEEGPALEAVRAWVKAAGIKPGTPLWRAIRKGHIQPDRMHQRTLHNIIQRRAVQMLRARRDEHGRPLMTAAEAAIAARGYSTHSLRRGALTSMGKAGATLAELIDVGRHSQKSSSIVLGYIEPGHVGARAMRKLGL